MAHSIEAEIELNYAVFLDLLGQLLPENRDRYALLHDRKLAGIFDTPGEAARIGFAKFGQTPYSIQIVTDQPVDLGFMSNAIREGAAPR